MLARVEVRLGKILDLRDRGIQSWIEVSEDRMRTEPWSLPGAARPRTESITQAIGRICWQAGIDGLVVPCSPRDGGSKIVVFRTDEDQITSRGPHVAETTAMFPELAGSGG